MFPHDNIFALIKHPTIKPTILLNIPLMFEPNIGFKNMSKATPTTITAPNMLHATITLSFIEPFFFVADFVLNSDELLEISELNEFKLRFTLSTSFSASV